MQVVFSMMEKITAPLKKITGGARDTGKALRDTSDRLRELNKQQKDLDGLRELHQGMRKTNAELSTAQQRVAELAARMKGTENPTRAMTREFNAAVRSVKSLQDASERQGMQYRALRERLADAGIGSRQLANAQTWLKNSIAATNAELADQQKKLAASQRQQQAMASARQRADKLRSTA
ncbi:phage tail protein, partial [Herbaspirillum frisingense]